MPLRTVGTVNSAGGGAASGPLSALKDRALLLALPVALPPVRGPLIPVLIVIVIAQLVIVIVLPVLVVLVVLVVLMPVLTSASLVRGLVSLRRLGREEAFSEEAWPAERRLTTNTTR